MRKMQHIRQNAWANRGFLKTESEVLKNIPVNAPYAKLMLKEREKFFYDAAKKGWTRRKYEQEVAKMYVEKEWREPGERYTDAIIFRMVRYYEQWWRNTASDKDIEAWVSPSAKKSHHQSGINHQRLLQQKRDYNSRPEVIRKRAEYRKKNRAKIAEARRQAKRFKVNN